MPRTCKAELEAGRAAGREVAAHQRPRRVDRAAEARANDEERANGLAAAVEAIADFRRPLLCPALEVLGEGRAGQPACGSRGRSSGSRAACHSFDRASAHRVNQVEADIKGSIRCHVSRFQKSSLMGLSGWGAVMRY